MNPQQEQVNYQHIRGFIAGAVAACGAVTFTNPWEVVKTRLQLQGELQVNTQNKPYGNAISAFFKVYKNEGITGIQRGLFPAYIYQILLNGFRLGMYDPIRIGLQDGLDYVYGKDAIPAVFGMVGAGALAGVGGAAMASPFFLIKTVILFDLRECSPIPKEVPSPSDTNTIMFSKVHSVLLEEYSQKKD
jgi:solute carrier family 25 protein 34/35